MALRRWERMNDFRSNFAITATYGIMSV